MAKKSKTSRVKQLSSSRPPNSRQTSRSVQSTATRALIRQHHTWQKQKAQAEASGNHQKAHEVEEKLQAAGGLAKYQAASLLGQAVARGGDSSRMLMTWLKPVAVHLKSAVCDGGSLRMLEVGALSADNACSRSRLFDMTRIDLRSTCKDVQEQDFMARPRPCSAADRFHIISLSLVLNYVADPVSRGEMLSRIAHFLSIEVAPPLAGVFPCLFLVLPLACVTNSRYMDEARLMAIMESLNYNCLERKISSKLIYLLFRFHGGPTEKQRRRVSFPKVELRAGSTRNNFAIVLK